MELKLFSLSRSLCRERYFTASVGERRGSYRVLVRNVEEGDRLKDVGVDGRIILKWILKKSDGGMDWIDLVQSRDRWRGLVMRWWTFGFHKIRGIFLSRWRRGSSSGRTRLHAVTYRFYTSAWPVRCAVVKIVLSSGKLFTAPCVRVERHVVSKKECFSQETRRVVTWMSLFSRCWSRWRSRQDLWIILSVFTQFLSF